MKKIFILILLALAVSTRSDARMHVPPTVKEIENQYRIFNEQYFDNKLPKDVVIDYSESVDMASTMKMRDGRFHIAFNDKFVAAPRIMNIVLIHEQCHVKTWEEILKHGPLWRTCMLTLDATGAFRNELIDNYEEKL